MEILGAQPPNAAPRKEIRIVGALFVEASVFDSKPEKKRHLLTPSQGKLPVTNARHHPMERVEAHAMAISCTPTSFENSLCLGAQARRSSFLQIRQHRARGSCHAVFGAISRKCRDEVVEAQHVPNQTSQDINLLKAPKIGSHLPVERGYHPSTAKKQKEFFQDWVHSKTQAHISARQPFDTFCHYFGGFLSGHLG